MNNVELYVYVYMDEQYMCNYICVYMDETLYVLVLSIYGMYIDEQMALTNFICIPYMCCDLYIIYVLWIIYIYVCVCVCVCVCDVK